MVDGCKRLSRCGFVLATCPLFPSYWPVVVLILTALFAGSVLVNVVFGKSSMPWHPPPGFAFFEA